MSLDEPRGVRIVQVRQSALGQLCLGRPRRIQPALSKLVEPARSRLDHSRLFWRGPREVERELDGVGVTLIAHEACYVLWREESVARSRERAEGS
jgi:hypothetical protein